MAYSKAACTLVCANEPDWQNERRMIRCGYCNECTPQIVQAACQCPKSSLHPRMFALNGGLESNPTIYLPFQSVKLKPSAGCFLCVMRQTVAQQPLTPSPVGEGWGEGFLGCLPILVRAETRKSGYGGDTPCSAFKFTVPVRVCALSRERERVAGCFVRFRSAFGRRMRLAERLVELRKQPAFKFPECRLLFSPPPCSIGHE